MRPMIKTMISCALPIAMVLSNSVTVGSTIKFDAVVWNMPLAYSASNYHSQMAQTFASAVANASDNDLLILTHPGGSLYKGGEIVRAVRTGQVQIGEQLISALSNEHPIFEIDALPFLATSFNQAYLLYRASLPELQQILHGMGLKLLYAIPWLPQGLYSVKPIHSAVDMKGVKFRAYNASTSRLAELMGAVPTKIEAAELPQAFSTGIAESMIMSAATGYDRKMWEHVRYWYDVQAWVPKNMVVVNQDAWDDLDATTQGILLGAAAMVEQAGWAIAQELAKWYKEQLAANGMKVTPPSERLRSDLEAIGAIMTEEWQKRAGAAGESALNYYRSPM